MLNEEQIHYMFYENGKTKDRTDPSRRVTCKLYWSKYFHKDIISQISEQFNIKIEKMEGLPFIANLAYCGCSFVEAIHAWANICNLTIANLKDDKDLITKARVEIFSLIGYIATLKNTFNTFDTYDKSSFICYPKVFKLQNFSKLLNVIGIRLEDSKIYSRTKNLEKIMKKTLGFEDANAKIKISTLCDEINEQLIFFTDIARDVCFTDEEDFIIFLLRFDLKKMQ